MSKNQLYAMKYAEYAMEQMRRYGIPASVTLAQGILESSNGQSRLAQNENNHFGIKATPAWIAEGGRYGIYTDDNPNEKFCSYDSVGDSYEHHSRFLKENSRYAQCFALSPDDYKGWTQNTEHNPLRTSENSEYGAKYSFPVEREEFLFVTSPFGMRQDPMDNTKQQMHKGIDIRCNGDAVLATENNGKVVAVNQNKNTPGGKSLTVEYTRTDGSKVQCTYMHLKEVTVKVGDVVQAGGKLGTSGNTGTRTTGEHLHFGVTNFYADGTKRDIDPAAYLTEIAQKGNIKLEVMHNGNSLLTRYKGTEENAAGKNLSPDGWMKKLLSSEDSGVGMSGCNDPIVEMAMTAFSSLMLLAVQIDNKNEEEQKTAISKQMDSGRINLKSLLPGMKNCELAISENGKAILRVNNGELRMSRELTTAELSRLSATLNNNTLTEEAKRIRVTGMLNTVILSEAASQNFEQGMSQQQGQTENLKR